MGEAARTRTFPHLTDVLLVEVSRHTTYDDIEEEGWELTESEIEEQAGSRILLATGGRSGTTYDVSYLGSGGAAISATYAHSFRLYAKVVLKDLPQSSSTMAMKKMQEAMRRLK